MYFQEEIESILLCHELGEHPSHSIARDPGAVQKTAQP